MMPFGDMIVFKEMVCVLMRADVNLHVVSVDCVVLMCMLILVVCVVASDYCSAWSWL